MAYSELIKNFDKIREYMKQFFVYGFKTRRDYQVNSARSYDNEKRRIESWLGDYMKFRQNPKGKISFISMDSRDLVFNPLFSAFKAKSFTPKDITLHFYILDILSQGKGKSAKEIMAAIDLNYLSFFPCPKEITESTLRKKLKEYEDLGLIQSHLIEREKIYQLSPADLDLTSFKDSLVFFTALDPLGVLGSFVWDQQNLDHEQLPSHFRFKHQYLLHGVESDLILDILRAIKRGKYIEVTSSGTNRNTKRVYLVAPLRVLLSTQNGRGYLLGWYKYQERMVILRLDNILKLELKDPIENREELEAQEEAFMKHLWGTSVSNSKGKLQKVSMTISIGEKEEFILKRLEREKRWGTVFKINETDKVYKDFLSKSKEGNLYEF